MKICTIEGCSAPVKARGYCVKHHHRFLRHGDPLGGGTFRGAQAAWITDHALHQGEGCLMWPFSVIAAMASARMMCEAAHGPPPSPQHEAAHSCGMGHEGCMNPRHLRWATRVENQHDRFVHGTHNRGSRHGMSKLTTPQVLEIRALARSKVMSQHKLAKRYGVTQSCISMIVNGVAWRHVPSQGTG
jgi:hypothetical protein